VAQQSIPAEKYVEILAELEPTFTHHPRAKELIARLLSELGCDSKTYSTRLPTADYHRLCPR
jgi:hypothetical protein